MTETKLGFHTFMFFYIFFYLAVGEIERLNSDDDDGPGEAVSVENVPEEGNAPIAVVGEGNAPVAEKPSSSSRFNLISASISQYNYTIFSNPVSKSHSLGEGWGVFRCGFHTVL